MKLAEIELRGLGGLGQSWGRAGETHALGTGTVTLDASCLESGAWAGSIILLLILK